MAETITSDIRIQCVAKELNVSWTHLVEHLQRKGFDVDKKPTIKISKEMYDILLREFSQDRADKIQADKISLSKPVPKPEEKPREHEPEAPSRHQKEEDEVLIKNVPQQPHIEKVAATLKEPVIETPKQKPVEAEIKLERIKAEVLEGPKIVGNIELEKLEPPKTEKKRGAKTEKAKKEESAAAPVAETIAPEVQPAEKGKEVVPVTEEEKTTEEVPQYEVKKTEYGKLEGPKVIGKLDLSSIKDKPADYSDIIRAGKDQKRKRKRIYSSDQPNPSVKVEKPEQKPVERPKPFQQRDVKRRDRRRFDRDQQTEISQKEVQDKIRETMARLSGGAKGRGSKSKYRRLKREDGSIAEDISEGKPVIQATEFISVSELASLMNVSATEVIKNCMNLGVIVSINQRLDAEVIELVAGEFGYEVEFISVEEQEEVEEDDQDDPASLKSRPPIVTIMGHVDHGKTSLLDYIRQTNVVAGEKGGITQHIGAYEVILPGEKKITFLDTPGHEAFTAMRARGAQLTDVVVIVIAVDDSVMPQTREAISHAQAAQVPMIFAFNKMDKPGASADRIRQQLAEMNLLVEEWGGKFQSQEISAKSGMGVDSLLTKILLESELLDLKANPDKVASGTVIEATLDKGRGYVASLLVQEGTLNLGDMVVAGSHYARVKAMFNERGQRLNEAGPSPVQVLGLDGAPQAGEKFKEFDDDHEAKQLAAKRQQIVREQGIRTKKHITLDEIGRRLALGNFKELNVIVKADFDGSVEALTDSLLKLSTPEIQVSIVHKAVGQITESDVLLASASDAIIIGFQVRPSTSARKLAEKENIEIRLYSVIYNAIDELKGAMEGMLEPKIEERITGNADVREVFKITKVGTVAGCMMTEGKIQRSNKVRLIREGIVIYSGELTSLKRFKDDAKEVVSGQECGIAIKNFNDIKVGDSIEGFEQTEVQRKL
jgi:translation initiation factor IF-2